MLWLFEWGHWLSKKSKHSSVKRKISYTDYYIFQKKNIFERINLFSKGKEIYLNVCFEMKNQWNPHFDEKNHRNLFEFVFLLEKLSKRNWYFFKKKDSFYQRKVFFDLKKYKK